MFSIDEDPGAWIDPVLDIITWRELLVYEVPDLEAILDNVDEYNFTSEHLIGTIFGCNIPCALIENIKEDPYEICDSVNADLEAMYSVLLECEILEPLEDDDIFYIHEIELKPEYKGFGYEKTLLLQLPSIIVKTLKVFPSLLMYFPELTQHSEPEIDADEDAILSHRMEYITQKIFKSENEDNIVWFPPKKELSEKTVNRYMGRRNPGDSVPRTHQNNELYKLYKSAGFKNAGQTGWLYKRIASIFTKDGLNR